MEADLAQCNVCGSEVNPDDVNWDVRYTAADLGKVFLLGILLGGFLRQLFTWLLL